MENVGLVFALVLATLVAVLLFVAPPWLRKRRRARLFGSGLPDGRRQILDRNLPLLHRMPQELRDELYRHVNVFLDEKRWLGCGGLELTEEMRVTIAGNACVLLLNRKTDYFPGFTSIYVYPDTYLVDDVEYDGEIEIHGRDARAGESWPGGPVILSWRDVLDTIAGEADGQNVVLHEFAHKLDEENPDIEGLPVLASAAHYREWEEVMTRAWDSLEETIARHARPAIDDYALTSPAEFFAVATEAFFEQPAAMRQQFPEVYEQLRKYFCVDPASWQGAL
ncbi:MAG TPA: M90 family metallopeptidase [Woeseiaceae bacterium]|nr:M90 family metallopeptidase [Woeseiaceae bacterium]